MGFEDGRTENKLCTSIGVRRVGLLLPGSPHRAQTAWAGLSGFKHQFEFKPVAKSCPLLFVGGGGGGGHICLPC